jgi:pyridoxine 4-dehydrogenase
MSAIGLGCMGMSDFYGSAAARDERAGEEVIKAALDAGVTLFNTGDFYGSGRNEALLGRALKGRRDQAVISVKFGALRSPGGAFLGYDGRPNSVKNFASYSLQRLGVDVIDIYQPSRVDPATPYEDTIGAVADLIQEGKVRYLGVSEANADQIRIAHAVHPVAALEIEYSLATRLIEANILPTARELGIGVIAYGVVGRGLLTGALPTQLAAEDFRAHLPRFQGDNLARNLEKTAILERIARERGATAAQIAIAWVLSRGEDVVPLVGTTNKTRLSENLNALEISLSPAELAELDASFPADAIVGDRYPTALMGMVAR